MNKEQAEVDVVAKAHRATQQIRQPSWAAHCQALSINLDEAEKEADNFQTRPTLKIKTPAYDFRPTPLAVVIPQVEELDLDWEV